MPKHDDAPAGEPDGGVAPYPYARTSPQHSHRSTDYLENLINALGLDDVHPESTQDVPPGSCSWCEFQSPVVVGITWTPANDVLGERLHVDACRYCAGFLIRYARECSLPGHVVIVALIIDDE